MTTTMSDKVTVLCLILHRDKSSLPRLSRSLPVATEAPMVLVVPSMGCTFWGGRRSRSCPRMEGGRPSFSRPYWPSWRALCVSGACPLRPPARGSLSSPLPAPLAPPLTNRVRRGRNCQLAKRQVIGTCTESRRCAARTESTLAGGRAQTWVAGAAVARRPHARASDVLAALPGIG